VKKHVVPLLVCAALSGSPRVAVADSDADVDANADKDAWYKGRAGRERKLHLVVTLSVGAAYLTTAVLFHTSLAPDECRWCDPPSIDARTRNALVWDHANRARVASDVLGAFAIPTLSVVVPNLLLIGTDPGWGDILDVTLPIAETVLATQILTYFAKSAVGRQRPYAHFGSARPKADMTEDNLSHWSGHSSLSFALATSAGMVAHMRDMKAEPAIWAVGMTLAASTGYLRIAGDMHYLTDVLVGAAVGVGAGLTIPRLVEHELAITTSGKSVMLVGQF
jgi:membrane-associated phospholipid phosphatase